MLYSYESMTSNYINIMNIRKEHNKLRLNLGNNIFELIILKIISILEMELLIYNINKK